MTVDEAYSLVVRAVETGRAAHGYPVCGDLRGECDALVGKVLRFLFPDQPQQVAQRCHPDVAWLEPEGRSRTIHVKSMREGIVGPMSATAFSGGWKVGVVVGADRMEEEAANSFLKTLEEPPPKTMFLLLTDQPDAVMPTIVSRSQRIDLPLSEGLLSGDAYDAVAEVMESRGVEGIYAKARTSRRTKTSRWPGRPSTRQSCPSSANGWSKGLSRATRRSATLRQSKTRSARARGTCRTKRSCAS